MESNCGSFVERFLDRFCEIAVGDIDDDVACLMITVLRKLQKYAHISWL